ncbi:hypothetical protein EDC31_1735 [Acidomonas methanolica]|nr:hypothetical protein EDC31_1735 [Acidomonas methanolica]
MAKGSKRRVASPPETGAIVVEVCLFIRYLLHIRKGQPQYFAWLWSKICHQY